MPYRAACILLCVCLAVLAGCSEPKEEVSTVIDISAIEPPDTPGSAEQLIGTKWEVGPYILLFKKPPEVNVSGQAVPIPGGVTAAFEVNEKGIIQISTNVMGRRYHHAGTWDGEYLVLDGHEAERL